MDRTINQRLIEVLATSRIAYADIAAGTSTGQSIRVSWTAETVRSRHPLAETLPNRRYLVASITKPVVSLQVVQLAAEGYFPLSMPLRELMPGFQRGPLRNITLRHLLTHTSGFPDMLPDNARLRQRQAPLDEFVRRTMETTPEFAPGIASRYSSMGLAVAAAFAEQAAGLSMSAMLRERLFDGLQMNDTWLGLPADVESLPETIIPSELPPWQSPDANWNWNSLYWRQLGAPWGGMIASAADLGKLAMLLLNHGKTPAGVPILSDAVVQACLQNQSREFSSLPQEDRETRPWGFGWRWNWPGHAACFSDFLPATAAGHWGATGTLMWLDPASGRWCVILTNQPYEDSQPVIQRLSNIVATAE